ncbi:MAG: hypothetical protein JWQ43_3658 [Glaciihabitans sp.]|nr:hypothetical protein [Glaciihabitans sp.]
MSDGTEPENAWQAPPEVETLLTWIDDNGPELVWHYTDQAGLQGILSSGEIWTTDTSYLNDSRELTFALDQMIDVVSRELAPADFAALKVLFAGGLRRSPRTLVACFCEEGDLLSQWRGYASPGGYAIGMDTRLLARHWMSEGVGMFLPVKYSESDATSAATRWAATVTREWKSALGGDMQALFGDKTKPDEDLVERFAPMLYKFSSSIGHLNSMAALYKHPAFSEELEWRFVTNLHEQQSNVGVRSGPAGLVPYRAMPFQKSTTDSPVCAIRIGPGLDELNQTIAVRDLLRMYGYSEDVDVVASAAPFRP